MNLRAASASALGLLLGACVAVPPATAPLSAESGASVLAARSLSDPGLRRFLVENLGLEPPAIDAAWDFESLAWVAFYYHPSLAVARAQWAATRASHQTASARPNPTVSLVPGYNSTREPGLTPWFPSVGLDFLLPTSAKRTHQQAIAAAEAEAARLSVTAVAWQVRAELRRALAEATAGALREPLLRAQAETQRHILTLLTARLSAGRVASPELSAARTALLKADSASAEAHRQTALARLRVANVLGLPSASLDGLALPPPPVAAPLAPAALADARRTSLQTRADVLAALARYHSTQSALALAAAKQQPDFHLGPGYQWDQGANKWSLALTFELPLFHRNEGPLAEAAARCTEAAAQFTAVQSQALAALDLAVATQASATQQREHAAQFTAELRQQLAAAQHRFALGSADQLELQSARLDLTAAEVAALDSSAALALASGQLDDALQIPFRNLAALAAARPSP